MCSPCRRGRPLCGCLVGIVALLVVAFSSPRSLAQFATAVAVTGNVAPDSGGNAFDNSFATPAINNFGQVAFFGGMPGQSSGLGVKVSGQFLTQAPTTASTTAPSLVGSVYNGTLTQVGLVEAPTPGPLPGFETPLNENDPNNPAFSHNVFYASFGNRVALNNTLVSVTGTNGATYMTGEVAFPAIGATRFLDPSSGVLIPLAGVFAGTPPAPPATTNMFTAALVKTNGPTVNIAVNGTVTTPVLAWTAFDPVAGPSLNNAGQIAFQASVTSSVTGGQDGIFIRNGNGAVAIPVALTNVTAGVSQLQNALFAPNINGSPTAVFTGFTSTQSPLPPEAALNSFGAVAFYATISGVTPFQITYPVTPNGVTVNETVNVNSPAGIFTSTVGGGPQRVAIQGDVAPPGLNSAGGFFRSIDQTVSMADNGLVLFKATVTTGPGAGDSGIYSGTATNVTPGTGGAGNLRTIAKTRDTAALTPALTGYSVLYPTGVFPAGTPTAGSPVGYVDFFSDVALNKTSGNPKVAFGSALSIGDGGGLFITDTLATTLTAVALSGNPAPGAGRGVTYGSFRGSPLALNTPISHPSSPELGFVAQLAGTGVTGVPGSPNNNAAAIFLTNERITSDPTVRETVMLSRTGDQLTVAPGVTKTIVGYGNATTPAFYSSTGNGRNSLNDWGQMATVVAFSDGTSGVYVFTPDLRLRDPAISGLTGTTVATTWGSATEWTFGYLPSNGIYKVIIDPADASSKAPTATPPPVTDVTVTGLTAQTLPGLQVGGVTGRAHLSMSGIVTLGQAGITDGSTVLTIQSGTAGTGPSNIAAGAGAKFLLNGDIRSLAGSTVAVISPDIDLGNRGPFVPVPAVTPPPAAAANTDVDKMRTITVDRGNFVGANPIDLRIDGIISSTDTATAGNRGIIKAGDGTLQLTGVNTFGPDATFLNGVAAGSPAAIERLNEVIRVTDGTLSISADRNLGAVPVASANVPLPRPRWLVLDGGTLQTTASLAIDPNRGISLGPTTGSGSGTINVFGSFANTLTYGGVIADNTENVLSDNNTVIGTRHGVGSLVKTGAGTLVLTGTNTYSGGTTINQGLIQVNGTGNLGQDGSSLTVNQPGALTLGAGVVINVGAFQASGGVTLAAGTQSVPTVMNNVSGQDMLLNPSARMFLGTNTPTSVARLDLGGQNLVVSGATIINYGDQSAGGTNGGGVRNGTVVVDFGGAAQGTGFYQAIAVGPFGFYSPGNSPGSDTVQNLAFNGGAYRFELMKAHGIDGVDSDLVHVPGTLAFDPADPILMLVSSLNMTDTPILLPDFDPMQTYHWTVAEAGSITGFDPSRVSIDSSGFLNPTNGGSFSLSQSGNDLILTFSPVPEPGTLALVGAVAAVGAWRMRRAKRVVAQA
jgi:autotransporter-associated beta strand protein